MKIKTADSELGDLEQVTVSLLVFQAVLISSWLPMCFTIYRSQSALAAVPCTILSSPPLPTLSSAAHSQYALHTPVSEGYKTGGAERFYNFWLRKKFEKDELEDIPLLDNLIDEGTHNKAYLTSSPDCNKSFSPFTDHVSTNARWTKNRINFSLRWSESIQKELCVCVRWFIYNSLLLIWVQKSLGLDTCMLLKLLLLKYLCLGMVMMWLKLATVLIVMK